MTGTRVRTVLTWVALVGVLFVESGAAIAQPITLTNPGFEAGTTGWGTTGPGTIVFSTAPGQGIGGSAAGCVTVGGFVPANITQGVTAGPGFYQVTLQGRWSGAAGDGLIRVGVSNGTTDLVSGNQQIAGAYTLYTFNIPFSANVDPTFFIRFTDSGGAGGNFTIDDITLTAVPEIDASSSAGPLGLLGFAGLLAFDRRRRRNQREATTSA